MPSKRKFYRTVIQYEVLSENPIGSVSLEDLAYETREGDWSGQFVSTKKTTIDAPTMAQALINQGSDPEFFQIDEKGNDIE